MSGVNNKNGTRGRLKNEITQTDAKIRDLQMESNDLVSADMIWHHLADSLDYLGAPFR